MFVLAGGGAGLGVAGGAVRAGEDAVHVHHLGDAEDLGPAEHFGDFGAAEAGSGDLEAGGGRDGGGGLAEASEGKAARAVDGVADAGDAEDVGNLVRVVKDGGGALRDDDRGVVMGQHV